MEKILDKLKINCYGTREETIEKLNSIENINVEIVNSLFKETVGLEGSSLEFELTVLEFVYYYKFIKPALYHASNLSRNAGINVLKKAMAKFYEAFNIEVSDINENIDSFSCINTFGSEYEQKIWERYMSSHKTK